MAAHGRRRPDRASRSTASTAIRWRATCCTSTSTWRSSTTASRSPIPEDVGRPLFGQCFYWLHTHTPDGIIHVESPTFRTYTLGQFFAIWGQPLSRTNVAGAKPAPGRARRRSGSTATSIAGDPRNIELTAHLDVMIDVGPPAAKPTPFTDWNGSVAAEMSESPGARTTGLSSCEFLVLRTPAPIAQPSAASKAIGFRVDADCSLPSVLAATVSPVATTIACRDSMMSHAKFDCKSSRALRTSFHKKFLLSTAIRRYSRVSTAQVR